MTMKLFKITETINAQSAELTKKKMSRRKLLISVLGIGLLSNQANAASKRSITVPPKNTYGNGAYGG